MNNIVIHGRLTRDPELKDYKTGKGETGKLCRFSVAVNRRFGDETDFFDCTCFGRSGESIEKWFRKGDGIVCSGEMQSRKGTKDDNKNTTYWSIIVQNWDFAEKAGQGGTKDAQTQKQLEDAGVSESFDQIDEDVPF